MIQIKCDRAADARLYELPDGFAKWDIRLAERSFIVFDAEII